MKLHILGINGSPRKGNSEYLLKEALEGTCEAYFSGRSVKINATTYSFRGKHFEPCLGCNNCIRKGGRCIHKDDFEHLQQIWLDADVIIYSVPVYHMTYPGQVKCFLDRLGNSMFGMSAVKNEDGTETLPKLFKVVAPIAQGIHIFSGQEHTLTDLINHALIMQCIPVTGDMWEAYIGAGGWTVNRDARNSFEQLCEEKDPAALAAVRACRSLGRRAVEMAVIIREGLVQRKNELKEDPLYSWIYNKLDSSNG
jgi:multimeric flavodoxin WrbA